ncbi:hypothetical protein GW17_00004411 [Ensete ventricosum]|nr:hypothetical protein GW17_00004411 [Ensete ventricosum]
MDGRTYESIMGGYTWMINEGVPTAGPTVWSYAGSDFWSQKSNISRKTGYKQFTRRQPLAAARILCELLNPFGESPSELPGDPIASSELRPMTMLYLGPSSGCNFIDPIIVRPARC